VDYRYAPGSRVPDDYARALDPTRTNPNVQSDPQQTLSVGLSQNFEAKLRTAAGDSAEPRKVKLLSLSTSSVGYNFEQARQAGRTGWTTQTLTNTLASDLLPGFSLILTHDLWDGRVGFDTTRFNPFLQRVSASFAVTPATLGGLAALFGLGRRAPVPAPVPADSATEDGVPGALDTFRGRHTSVVAPQGGGSGFSLSVTYSGTRVRDNETSLIGGGQQTLNLALRFSPTRNWQVSWSTAYDVDTRQFSQHIIQLERNLHRWYARFGYTRTATGSFAFNFQVALRDQPDIKFDYDQQTFVQ
jgi:hypothetical protein